MLGCLLVEGIGREGKGPVGLCLFDACRAVDWATCQYCCPTRWVKGELEIVFAYILVGLLFNWFHLIRL